MLYNRATGATLKMASSIHHPCSRSGEAWFGRCWDPETSVAEVVVEEVGRGFCKQHLSPQFNFNYVFRGSQSVASGSKGQLVITFFDSEHSVYFEMIRGSELDTYPVLLPDRRRFLSRLLWFC